jgi:hypothetical protein
MAHSLEYRLYLLNREGRIVRAEIIRCSGDPEAITAARDRAAQGPYSTELWLRSRRIGSFPQDARPGGGSVDGPDP